MSSVTTEPLRDCLSSWRDEQAQLEAELSESFSALEAFERSLEAWRDELACERASLKDEREGWEREVAAQREATQHAFAEPLDEELNQSRTRVAELESQLAAKTRELADQNDHWSREFERVVQQLENQQAVMQAPAETNSDGNRPDPVLGSVVAQFGKLRKQRAERGGR